MLINVLFLSVLHGKITINRSHKYYMQMKSQMKLSKSTHGCFVVWTTTKDIFIEKKK